MHPEPDTAILAAVGFVCVSVLIVAGVAVGAPVGAFVTLVLLLALCCGIWAA